MEIFIPGAYENQKSKILKQKIMEKMTTTFHAPSGQQIRQMQEHGTHHVTIEKRETDLVHRSRSNGQDSFTREIWSSDAGYIEKCIREWSHRPELLTFGIRERD